MKLARIIFVALCMFGTYYVTKSNRVEDKPSPPVKEIPRPKFSIDELENNRKLNEMIDRDGEDGKLEEKWDPNYIQFDPTYRHYTGDDSLDGYMED